MVSCDWWNDSDKKAENDEEDPDDNHDHSDFDDNEAEED